MKTGGVQDNVYIHSVYIISGKSLKLFRLNFCSSFHFLVIHPTTTFLLCTVWKFKNFLSPRFFVKSSCINGISVFQDPRIKIYPNLNSKPLKWPIIDLTKNMFEGKLLTFHIVNHSSDDWGLVQIEASGVGATRLHVVM